MKRILLLTALTFIFLSALTAQEKPNILLITIDTWRADYISASGSGKVETPFLDKLASEGRYAARIETPVPYTTPAHASILTGLYPKDHQIRDNIHFRLKPGVKTIAELCKESGYETIAVVSAAPLKKNYGLDRGFDIYDDNGVGIEGDDALVPSSRKGEESAGRALDYAMKAGQKKVFLWLHLYEPHHPYSPPQEFLKRYPADRYAGEVAYTDKIIDDFIQKLLSGKKGRWVVLVTGDHGEGLGEKGEETHGILLYKATREVPLIVWDNQKQLKPLGKGFRSLTDIFPAIAEMVSMVPPICDGISLFKDSPQERWLFSESLNPTMNFGLNPALSASRGGKILIRHGTSEEVYSNGDENRNLYSSEKDFSDAASEELKRFFANETSPSSNLKLSGEELKTLASLGYIGSNSQGQQKTAACDLRVFAKDFTELISPARGEMSKGNLEKAVQMYESVVRKYPNSAILRLERGSVFVGLKRFDDARDEFRACLQIDPRNSVAFLNLGNIMMMKGKRGDAEQFYLSSLSCEEDQAEAHLNLGLFYAQTPGKNEAAVKHLKRFIQLAPNDPEARGVGNMINKLEGRGSTK